jgi:cytoskeletal protein RodZ
MKVWRSALMSLLCGSLIVVGFQAAALPAEGQQPGVSQAKLESFPDSPGATRAQSPEQSPPQQSAPQQQNDSRPQDNSQPAPASQSTQAQPSQNTSPSQKPVGTAAAETPVVSGVAASQPAGVAIAPARQRRVRTLVLRVGAIVGAGVAVGTVAALSRATPSKPPGAH